MQALTQHTAAAAPARAAAPRSGRPAAAAPAPLVAWQRRRQPSRRVAARARVELLDLEGVTHVLEVADDQSILEVAIDEGLDMPYDCKMGVCLRCSAKIESGQVDQPGGMISEECQAQGYALMCVAYPKTDCSVRVIPEGELVDAVMNIA